MLEDMAVHDDTGRMVRQRLVASWGGETDIFEDYYDHLRASRLIAHSKLHAFEITPSMLVYHELTDRPNRLYIAVRIPVRSMDLPVFNERAHVSLAYDAIMDFEVPCRHCAGGIADDSAHAHCVSGDVMRVVSQFTCCRMLLTCQGHVIAHRAAALTSCFGMRVMWQAPDAWPRFWQLRHELSVLMTTRTVTMLIGRRMQ
jgi:hypothetical protein